MADKKMENREFTLRHSDLAWEKIFDSFPDMVLILNDRYEIIQINKSMADALGQPVNNLLFKKCYQVVHGSDKPPSYCPHSKVLADRKEHSAEFYEDNLNLHLQAKASPLYDTQGNFVGSVYITRDITGNIEREEQLRRLNTNLEKMVTVKTSELRARENVLQAIFATTPVGIGVVKNNRLNYANSMLSSITGYSEKELLDLNILKLYPDRTEFNFINSECHRQRQRFGTCTVETKWVRKDGIPVDILYSSTPIEADNPEANITFSAWDITQKKETEKNLSSAYNELNQIFNAAVPICLISKGCSITRVNKAFCDFFKVAEDDALNKDCQNFWKCDKCETEHCALHLLQSGQPSFHRYIEIELNGKKLTCSVHSVPHYDTHGSFVGTITTFFDMSAHKAAQDQLEKTRKQLLHSEKLSAVGRLSASIAHEFNNPLYGIMNVLSGIQKRSPLSEEDRKLANLALKECNRIKFLISELQQFNRPSSGVRESFDIHQTIEEILLFHKKEFKNKKMAVKKEYGSGVPKIWAVKDQIKQVLVNLFNNAGDAMPAEGGIMTVTTGPGEDGVYIAVQDNGDGILPENIEKIFEPFYTTKPAVKGTGLGLPVSFGIIKSHGGNIAVESVQGQGATFTITLPIEMRR